VLVVAGLGIGATAIATPVLAVTAAVVRGTVKPIAVELTGQTPTVCSHDIHAVRLRW
jgi:hypothetical protein